MSTLNTLQHAPILIVDDQRPARELLRSSLRQLGYQNIVEAIDGEDALEILAHRHVRLVVSGYDMPKLDGLCLLRAVRGLPHSSNIAFIFITSHSETSLVEQAKALGISGYLIKPFALGPLKQRVEAALNAVPH